MLHNVLLLGYLDDTTDKEHGLLNNTSEVEVISKTHIRATD